MVGLNEVEGVEEEGVKMSEGEEKEMWWSWWRKRKRNGRWRERKGRSGVGKIWKYLFKFMLF